MSASIQRAIAGAVVYDAESTIPAILAKGLRPEAWTDARPRIVMETALRMYLARSPIDALTIQATIERDGTPQATAYEMVTECLAESPSLSAFEHTLQLFIDDHIRREASRDAVEFAGTVRSADEPSKEIHALSARLLAMVKDELADKRTNEEKLGQAVDVWREIANGGRRRAGMTTGLEELDRITGGLMPTRMYILGGRPSAGKTSLGLQMANAQVEAGASVGWIGMDMGSEDLLQRLACHKTGSSLSLLNRGETRRGLESVQSVVPVVGKEPWHFKDDTRDWNRCAAWARMTKAKHGMDVLYIDYIQQLTIDGMNFHGKDNSRITHISGQVKLLARELKIPIVALAQLRRMEGGENVAPTLSDLRDSGSLEQDAYAVFMLYRSPTYVYNPAGKEKRHAICCRIEKQQNGETGDIPLWFDKPCFKFAHDPRPDDESVLPEWLNHWQQPPAAPQRASGFRGRT